MTLRNPRFAYVAVGVWELHSWSPAHDVHQNAHSGSLRGPVCVSFTSKKRLGFLTCFIHLRSCTPLGSPASGLVFLDRRRDLESCSESTVSISSVSLLAICTLRFLHLNCTALTFGLGCQTGTTQLGLGAKDPPDYCPLGQVGSGWLTNQVESG